MNFFEETHVLTKQETLLGGDTLVESRRKATWKNFSATWLAVWGFMIIQLVSELSLANHSDSGSFLVAHTLLSQEGWQQEGFREVVGPVGSPFDFFRIFLVGGSSLLVSHPLPHVVR